MIWLLLVASVLQPTSGPIDVSALKISAPTAVAELDLGKLKGELRQVCWAPDGATLYLLTAEGNANAEKLHHYLVAVDGGAVKPIDAAPDWARTYWDTKSDRAAPGIGSLLIDVEQKFENMKFGTGSAGAADRSSDGLGAGNINTASNVEKAAESQHVNVVRLKLYDTAVSEFVNERVVPGRMFGWGPEKSGAIAYTTRDGDLLLLDGQKHKRSVRGAKDATLPAWSLDGSRLAWAQKSGRRKATLVYAIIE